MSKAHFSLTIEEQAAALDRAFNWVRTRRRILTALVEERKLTWSDDLPQTRIENMVRSLPGIRALKSDGQISAILNELLTDTLSAIQVDHNLAIKVRIALIQELARSLKLHAIRSRGWRFEFDPGIPDTLDYLAGVESVSKTYGGQGQTGKDALRPIFGLVRDGDKLVPDGEAAECIKTAFDLMIEFEHDGSIPWVQVASELNDAGCARQDGSPWEGDDVRELTRVTTYAGYVCDKRNSKYGENIHRDERITSLVDLPKFVFVAERGRGRKASWLPVLKQAVSLLPAWEREVK